MFSRWGWAGITAKHQNQIDVLLVFGRWEGTRIGAEH